MQRDVDDEDHQRSSLISVLDTTMTSHARFWNQRNVVSTSSSLRNARWKQCLGAPHHPPGPTSQTANTRTVDIDDRAVKTQEMRAPLSPLFAVKGTLPVYSLVHDITTFSQASSSRESHCPNSVDMALNGDPLLILRRTCNQKLWQNLKYLGRKLTRLCADKSLTSLRGRSSKCHVGGIHEHHS